MTGMAKKASEGFVLIGAYYKSDEDLTAKKQSFNSLIVILVEHIELYVFVH